LSLTRDPLGEISYRASHGFENLSPLVGTRLPEPDVRYVGLESEPGPVDAGLLRFGLGEQIEGVSN
jgi:hypothetical protein